MTVDRLNIPSTRLLYYRLSSWGGAVKTKMACTRSLLVAALALASVADGLHVPGGISRWPTACHRLTSMGMTTAHSPAAPPPPPPPHAPSGYTDLMLLTCGGLEDVTCDLVESRLGVDRDGGEFVLEVAAYASGKGGGSREDPTPTPAPAPAPAGFRGGEAAVGKVILRLNDASRGLDTDIGPGPTAEGSRSLGELVAELEASCGVQTALALVCFEPACFSHDTPVGKAAALAELTDGNTDPTPPVTFHLLPSFPSLSAISHRPPAPTLTMTPQPSRRVEGNCGRRRWSGGDGAARRRHRLASCASARRACATATMLSRVRTLCAR